MRNQDELCIQIRAIAFAEQVASPIEGLQADDSRPAVGEGIALQIGIREAREEEVRGEEGDVDDAGG